MSGWKTSVVIQIVNFARRDQINTMTVENEAFVDIEMALHNRVEDLWLKQWRPIQKELNTLAAENTAASWHEAHRLTNSIDWEPVVSETIQLARTLAEAALFLGASRIDDPSNSSFFGAPDERLIDIATEQWSTVLVKNAVQALRLQAQVILGDMEVAAQAKNLIVKAPRNPLTAVGIQGGQYSGIAASLMISRASTAGFFAEAQARGIQVYKVSEVLDSVTCPVCRLMHNQEFPVSSGIAQSMSVMQATDPDSLKTISPWPSQSASNVKSLSVMNQGQLIGAGLNLPPYHPWCRGIATIITKGGGSSAAGGILGSRLLLRPDEITPDQLGNRLFGDLADLEGAEFEGILALGAGALFGDNEDEN